VMTYHVETVDFKEYVKGVLPNEWLPNWNDEALKAGAVAVKQFGLLDAQSGFVWDCNFDQVYNPAKRTEQTDKAVNDTWDNWLIIGSNGSLVQTFYDDYPDACYSRGYDCMSQYESQRLAEEGWTFEEILLDNYSGELLVLPFSRLDWNLSWAIR
jgi:peptidoglycan hydrolase-like amidase